MLATTARLTFGECSALRQTDCSQVSRRSPPAGALRLKERCNVLTHFLSFLLVPRQQRILRQSTTRLLARVHPFS